MGVDKSTYHNHILYTDEDNSQRWVGLIGPLATKWELTAETYGVDEFTLTQTNTTVAQVTGALGGALVFTPAGAENDGAQIQLLGEAFLLSGNYPAYFGVRFKLMDADQNDAVVGLCIQDTDVIGAVTDGAFFRTLDESAVLNFVLAQDSVETSSAVTTMTDSAYVVAEFVYDGADSIDAYIDGVLRASHAITDLNMPDDEYLSPVLAMLTGEAVANTMTVTWARAYQIRE